MHEGGFAMHRQGAGHVFFAPDGRRVPAVPRPPRSDAARLVAANRRARVQVSAETPSSLGRGERLDLGLAVDALLHICRPARE